MGGGGGGSRDVEGDEALVGERKAVHQEKIGTHMMCGVLESAGGENRVSERNEESTKEAAGTREKDTPPSDTSKNKKKTRDTTTTISHNNDDDDDGEGIEKIHPPCSRP